MGGNPSRAGSTRLTAMEVAERGTKERGKDLTGQTYIVTGSNGGIGLETARVLASQNASVVLACRNMEAAAEAAKKVNEEFPPKDQAENKEDKVTCMKLDLSDFDSVRAFAKEFKERDVPLNCLINNAAVMHTSSKVTKQGFESTWGVNHLGVFLLTNLLLDKPKASTPSRIVTVASLAHNTGSFNPKKYPDQAREVKSYGFVTGQTFYADSKLMNIYMAKKLHRMLEGTGVTSYCLHPGVIKTPLFREMPGNWLWQWMVKGVEQGAATTVYCATYPSVVEDAGEYFSECRVKAPASHANNEELQDELWTLSEKLTGLAPSESDAAPEEAAEVDEQLQAAETTSS